MHRMEGGAYAYATHTHTHTHMHTHTHTHAYTHTHTRTHHMLTSYGLASRMICFVLASSSSRAPVALGGASKLAFLHTHL